MLSKRDHNKNTKISAQVQQGDSGQFFETEEKMLNEIGRVCVKIAGRDAGRKCIIIEVLDKNYVLVDGETRRKKVNTAHLEPLDILAKVKKGASHEEVMSALKEASPKAEKTAESRPVKKKETKAKTKKK